MERCDAVEGLLSAAIDGELPPDTAATVDAHLRGCAACRAERERLLQVRSLLRAMPARNAPEGLRAALRHGARRGAAAVRRRRRAAAGALMAALLAGALLGTLNTAADDDSTAPVPIDGLVREHLAHGAASTVVGEP